MARYSVKQVAGFWNVTPHTVYNLVERGELTCLRIGRSVRFRDEDIEEYEKRKCRPALIPATHTSGGTPTDAGILRIPMDVGRLARQTYKPPSKP